MSLLPDPDRPPMTPLPAELLAHILKLAQADEPLSAQFKIRLQFEHVCRAWYMCDNKWRVVSIDGFDQLQALLDTMIELRPKEVAAVKGKRGQGKAQAVGAAAGAGESRIEVVDDIALRVRSFSLNLADNRGTGKGEMAAKLVSMMVGLERVEFRVSGAGLGRRGNCLGNALTKAVVKLKKLKHLVIDGPIGSRGQIWISDTFLKELMPKLPTLESITLADLMYEQNKPFPRKGPFSACTLLESFEIAGWSKGSGLAEVVCELPPSTRKLNISSISAFEETHNWTSLEQSGKFAETRKGLTELAIFDGRSPSIGRTIDRGRFDNFIDSLDNLTTLTISPAAITDLGALARRPKLTDLTVQIGFYAPSTTVSIDEVRELLANSNSLINVRIGEKVVAHWSKKDKQDANEAAQPNINLVWV